MGSIFKANVKPENLKFFKITQVAYIIGFFGHIFAAYNFTRNGVIEMVWFNCIYSIPAFAFSFFVNRKGKHNLAFVFGFIELLFHQALAIYYIGWESGTHYWLIYLIGLSFFNAQWKNRVRFFLFTTVICTFFILYIFFKTPEFYTFSEAEYNLMYLSSSGLSLFLLALLINFYVQTANNAEKKLQSANIELSKKNSKIQETLNERDVALRALDNELNQAADYVRTILPKPFTAESAKVDWRFIPSASLGGDAFGYHWLDDDHLSIYLIDVSGHGVRPALLSVSVINTLRSQSLPEADFKDPSTVLIDLNKAFPSEKNNAMFFTIWYGVYNKKTSELSFASGGHPPALLLGKTSKSEQTYKELRTPNIVIGALEDAEYTKELCYVEKGSSLLIFSDGVYEIRKKDGTMLRFNEYTDHIEKLRSQNALNMDNLMAFSKKMNGTNKFQDDFTILEVRF